MTNKGQTAVEYVLLLAVISLMAYGVYKILRENLIARNNCQNPDSDGYICRVLFSGPGGFFAPGSNYRRFTIPNRRDFP